MTGCRMGMWRSGWRKVVREKLTLPVFRSVLECLLITGQSAGSMKVEIKGMNHD